MDGKHSVRIFGNTQDRCTMKTQWKLTELQHLRQQQRPQQPRRRGAAVPVCISLSFHDYYAVGFYSIGIAHGRVSESPPRELESICVDSEGCAARSPTIRRARISLEHGRLSAQTGEIARQLWIDLAGAASGASELCAAALPRQTPPLGRVVRTAQPAMEGSAQ